MHRFIGAAGIVLTLLSCRTADVEEQLSLVGKWKYTAVKEQHADWKPVTGTFYEGLIVEFTAEQKITYTINNIPATDACRVPCSPKAFRLNKEDITFTEWYSCRYIDCAPVTAWALSLRTTGLLEVIPREQPTLLLRLERTK